MTAPMSPEELRACRERAERMPAMPAGDALRFSERSIPRLLATIDALQARTEKAEGKARQFERDWYDAKAEFGGAVQERDEQIARLKNALVANATGARTADRARGSAACELDDIATTREMACATRIFGHDHPEFHDLSNAEWVAELLNAYQKDVRK